MPASNPPPAVGATRDVWAGRISQLFRGRGYGTTNDVAIPWPLAGTPVSMVAYSTQDVPDVQWQDEVIAAARIALQPLRKCPAPRRACGDTGF
jgi:hypothetical protein